VQVRRGRSRTIPASLARPLLHRSISRCDRSQLRGDISASLVAMLPISIGLSC
jgi:hypothetical protein